LSKRKRPLGNLVEGPSPPGAHATGYSDGDSTPKVPSVKVCPHCAEELPDEATVCPNCHKDPALAPAWNVPLRPDETSLRRLGNVFGPDGVLPTSDQVPSPFGRLEPSKPSKIPLKVWSSLILAVVWGFALRMIERQTSFNLLLWARFMLPAAGYIAGLILGIWGRAESGASERRAETLGIIAIALNAYHLAWIVYGAIQYGVAARG
jgi:zinc ribbon protein